MAQHIRFQDWNVLSAVNYAISYLKNIGQNDIADTVKKEKLYISAYQDGSIIIDHSATWDGVTYAAYMHRSSKNYNDFFEAVPIDGTPDQYNFFDIPDWGFKLNDVNIYRKGDMVKIGSQRHIGTVLNQLL